MPTIASQIPAKMPIVREKDMLVYPAILEGKLAQRGRRSFADSETITASFVFAARDLLGAGRATGDPNLHLRHGILAGKRRQCPPVARAPAPAHKVVVGDVIEQLFQRPPAILFRI